MVIQIGSQSQEQSSADTGVASTLVSCLIVDREAWDPIGWLARFRAASEKRQGPELRRLRAEVFAGTVDAVTRRSYVTAAAAVSLDDEGEYESLHLGTAFYPSAESLVVPPAQRRSFRTCVSVEDADCLEVAKWLGGSDDVPAVLNMASRRNPGGGALAGAGAQEENLFRRSSLLWSLYQFAHYAGQYGVPRSSTGHAYPIPRESGGIYSPPAWVFRSSEATGYAFLPEPYRAAFLTVPAIARPDTVEGRDGGLRLTDAMVDATRRKIRAIFRIASAHGHTVLVLSAFGCGAFGNPPHHMAQLFRGILEEQEFEGVFRRIVFAIFDDHNATGPEGNHRPFAREFTEAPT